jgi:NAD(P)-dependent dehydrogenase (short-subunit alcohol dehydrogenase family)
MTYGRRMDDVFDHSGEVAVVTGGGTGIGAATAMLFAQHGADVVLASRKVENLERVATDVEQATGRRAHIVATDVRDVEQCERLIDESLDTFGRVDVLVNNAGGSHSYAFEDWNADRFQNMIDLNLKSAFVLSQRVAPHMVERGSGSIVNISSGAAVSALPIHTAYGAAKAGLENLTQNFAAALAPHGIRVNCVRVGAIKSEGFLRAMDAAGIDPDEMGGRAAGLGRAGTPDEIAWPVLFLASAASSYVSGQTLYVGGGPKDITS